MQAMETKGGPHKLQWDQPEIANKVAETAENYLSFAMSKLQFEVTRNF